MEKIRITMMYMVSIWALIVSPTKIDMIWVRYLSSIKYPYGDVSGTTLKIFYMCHIR